MDKIFPKLLLYWYLLFRADMRFLCHDPVKILLLLLSASLLDWERKTYYLAGVAASLPDNPQSFLGWGSGHFELQKHDREWSAQSN